MVKRLLIAGIKLIVLSFAFISTGYADVRFSETKSEDTFPTRVAIEYNNEQRNLFLTGSTIRRKFFLKIYAMAHYLERKPGISDVSDEQIYENILEDNSTKQISMIFLRALTAKQIQNSLISGIKLNTNEEQYLQITPQLEEFIQPINGDVIENDEFIIRWLPDGTLVSIFQGEEISAIKNNGFARALWSIWFGNESVVDRKSLIKELLTSS